MKRRRILPLLLILLSATTGVCADAVSLRNEVLRVDFSPRIGRIVYFGAADGSRNFLWTAPDSGRTAVDGSTFAWNNVGGERFWPVPSSAFQTVFQQGWPPPAAIDGIVWRVAARKPGMLALEGEAPALGLRLHRTLRLPPGAESLILDHRLERVAPVPVPVQIWLIAQLRPPLRGTVEPVRAVCGFAWRKLEAVNRPWQGVALAGERLNWEPRGIPTGGKFGVFGTRVQIFYPDAVLTLETELHPEYIYPELSNIQLYCNPPSEFGDYAEVEFQGDYRNLKQGESTSLRCIWHFTAGERR